MKCQGA